MKFKIYLHPCHKYAVLTDIWNKGTVGMKWNIGKPNVGGYYFEFDDITEVVDFEFVKTYIDVIIDTYNLTIPKRRLEREIKRSLKKYKKLKGE